MDIFMRGIQRGDPYWFLNWSNKLQFFLLDYGNIFDAYK